MNQLSGENFEVYSPGLLDPGAIIMGKVSPIDTTGTDYWPSDGNIPMPELEFDKETSILVQYKADTNKFLGYIGDLAEYNFKHIPEKYYYNNISVLELLCPDDQRYLGTDISTFSAITKNFVPSEIIGNDFTNSSSLPTSNYDKLRPKYFGTVKSGDRTIMLFMVPPGYDTVFISNGPDVYSMDDYFSVYGNLLGSWFEDRYMEASDSAGGSINNATGPASGYGNGDIFNFDFGSPELVDPKIFSAIGAYEATNIDPNTDPNPEPDNGGRGRGNTTPHSIVSNLGNGYSLVVNLDSGLTTVIPAEGPNTGSEIELYDYWFPSSSYVFVPLSEYDLYIKYIGTSSITGQDISPDNDYYVKCNKNRLSRWIKAGSVDIFEISPEENLYGAYVYVKLNGAYKNLRGVTKYVLDTDTQNSYGCKIYRKIKNYPTANDDIRDCQFITFKMVGSGQNASISNIFIPPKVGAVWEKMSDGYISSGNVQTLDSVPVTGEGYQVGDIIKVGNDYYKYKGTTTNWLIKKYKENNTNADPFANDYGRPTNVDIPTDNHPEKTDWTSKYGRANYYKYLEEVCQAKIRFTDDSTLDYYKLIKLVISPSEVQEYSIERFNAPGGTWDWILDLNSGDLFSYNGEVLRIILRWEVLNRIPTGGYLTLTEIPSTTDNYDIETVIKVDNVYYELIYVIEKTIGDIDSIPSLNLDSGSVEWKVRMNSDNQYMYSIHSDPLKDAIESINVVNISYQTSENPLKNLDKYLARGDERFVKKYSKVDSGIIDLTSGTYVSPGIRKVDDESKVSTLKYSYRKTYRKGQRVLMGLDPYDLHEDIIDIQYIVPTIYSSLDADVEVDGATEYHSSIDPKLTGSVVYDYSSGHVYKIRETREWKAFTGTPTLEVDYIVSSLPDPYNPTYSVGDTIKVTAGTGTIKFYELIKTSYPNIEIKYTADTTHPYLYRYWGEYYMIKGDETSLELQRVSYFDVRTWISLEDNNKSSLPGISRKWMSRDGDLTIGDKVWIMLASGSVQKKILGEVIKRGDTNTGTYGVGLRIVDEPLENVHLNGVSVLVDNYNKQQIEYRGSFKYVYDLYMMKGNTIADITKNLIFKDKINYLIKL